MSIARGDQETIIRRDSSGWHAWSNIQSDIHRFERQGWKLDKSDQYGSEFSAPDHAVGIKPAKKREYTDEQRAVMAERMRAMRKSDGLGQTK